MKTKILILMLFASLFFSPLLLAADNRIVLKSGFISADVYMKLNFESRSFYIMGFFDAFATAQIFTTGRYTNEWEKFFDKTGIKSNQIEAVVTKYLKEHPERWHEPLNFLITLALRGAFTKPNLK